MSSSLMDSVPLSESKQVTGNGNRGHRQVDGLPDVGFGVVAGGDVRGPVGRVVRHGQRPGELAPGAGPAVRDRVGLRQARQARDLVGALADLDRVAQMLAGRTRQRHAPGHGRPFERPEPPVDGRRAHRAHLLERVPVQSSSSPSALSAGIHWSSIAFMYGPHGMPINSHNRSNSRCVSSPYFGLRPRPGPWSFLGPDRLREQTPCRGPAHAHGHEPVDDLALLLLRSLGVLRPEPVRQPLPRGHVQSAFHKASIPAPGHAGRDFTLTIYDEQTRISRSNITTNVGTIGAFRKRRYY